MDSHLEFTDIPQIREDLLSLFGLSLDITDKEKNELDSAIKAEAFSKQDLDEVKRILKSKKFRNVRSLITDLVYASAVLKQAKEDEDSTEESILEEDIKDMQTQVKEADKDFSSNLKAQNMSNVVLAMQANEMGKKMKADSTILGFITNLLIGGVGTALGSLLVTCYLCHIGAELCGLAFKSTGVVILSSGATISLASIGAGSFLVGGVLYGVYKLGQASVK